jgi:general secretion pathway protein K
MNTSFHKRRNQSGVALVIVMISIFVLTILAGRFALAMKIETKLAHNANNETELEWLGRSGVEYARWVLAAQMNIPQEPYDALNQVWAGGSGGTGTSNSPLANVENPVSMGKGTFTWKIKDLERKANINSASEPMLQQALTLMGVNASDMTPVISSIQDWIDPDNTTHLQGAETEYYQTKEPPYEAKNGPIDDISELQFIKGIDGNLYWGPSWTNHQAAAFQSREHKFGFQDQSVPMINSGLVDLFTPVSSGKININTASADVLQLIPGIDATIAEAIVGARGGEDDGSGLTGPYRSVDQVRRVPEVTMEVARGLQQYCDVRSRTFEVTVEAEIAGYKREFVAIIARNSPKDVQILNFYWK